MPTFVGGRGKGNLMHNIGFIVFGLTGLLALTSLLPGMAPRLKLPYSVLLAVAGSLLGLGWSASGPHAGRAMVTDFLNALANLHISSEAFLVCSCRPCCSRARSPSTCGA